MNNFSIEMRFRRRASVEPDIRLYHETIVKKLSLIPGLWKNDQSTSVPLDLGEGESAAANLAGRLSFGLEGQLSYASRWSRALSGKATADDFLIFRGNVDKRSLSRLNCNIFPQVVSAFLPYRAACVTDLDMDLADFDEIVEKARSTNLDIDGRDSVYRLWSANYFDEELCLRAFRVGSRNLADKLSTIFEIAMEFEGGALLVSENAHTNAVAFHARVSDALPST